MEEKTSASINILKYHKYIYSDKIYSNSRGKGFILFY